MRPGSFLQITNCRALKPSDPGKLPRNVNDLSPEQREERKRALKNMLASNEVRHQQAAKRRRPKLVPGKQVAIIAGEFAGKLGVVQDADFITGRVQLMLDDLADTQWIAFKDIASV